MRNHLLKVGEVVFDINQNCFGVITELTNGVKGEKAKISMVQQSTFPNQNLPIAWCKYQTKLLMDCEITETEWETTDLDALYQIAWGVRDIRTNNIVCYEHQDFEDDYPYYSPYLEENLFSFEVSYI